MITSVWFGALAALLFGPAGAVLARSSWPSRAPRAAVLLWQAIGLAGAISAAGAGLAIAIAPLHTGLLDGVLELGRQARAGHPLVGLWVYGAIGLTLSTDVSAVLLLGLVATVLRTARTRARHRVILDLVGARSSRAPGALLLEDTRAAAYYLPGIRPRIVLSRGTLGLLDDRSLAAVIAHERGHAQEHHGLVMLPFASMDSLLRWMPYVRHARHEVTALLEMAADDYATKAHERHVLAAALVEMSTSRHPICAFAANGTDVVGRVDRLINPARRAKLAATVAVMVAALTLAVPASLMFVR